MHEADGHWLAVPDGYGGLKRRIPRWREDLQGHTAQGHPAERFWSFTVYDNQTRSMLGMPQRYPRAGSQSYPSPAAAANSDGSTTVYFGPKQPAGVANGNWIQTVPGKGWNTLLRFYSPKESFPWVMNIAALPMPLGHHQ